MIKDTNKHFYHLEQFVSNVHYTPVPFPEIVFERQPQYVWYEVHGSNEIFALPQWNWNQRQTTEL